MIRAKVFLHAAALFFLLLSPINAEEPNEKAQRYHSALLNRPAPGYLFDRFYNSWLDTGSIEGLESFLKNQIENENTTSRRLLLAYFYTNQREHLRALEQFSEALKNDPDNADAWFQKARIESRMLQFETAINDLTKALESNPSAELAIEIRKLQGSTYARNSQKEEALAVWQALLADNPDDEELHEDLIELQVSEGLFDEALLTADKLTSSINDTYEWVIRTMRAGDIHQRLGERDAALETYSSTLDKVGNGTWLEKEILAQIEQLFRREENLTGLQTYLNQLSAKYPTRISLKERLAGLAKDLGEKENAIALHEEILKLTPGERSYRETYVEMLASLGETERAITQLKQLITTYPDDGELQIDLADLYHRTENAEETRDAIHRYLETSDQSEYAYLRTARLLERYELIEEATDLFDRITATFPESLSAIEAHASFLHEHERSDEAITLWKQLAENSDRSQLVSISRALSSRNEYQAAFDILLTRQQDFPRDSIFLAELSTLALTLERFEEAIPWSLLCVQIAETPFDLESAIDLTLRVARGADHLHNLLAALTEKDSRTLQETCLLAELYEAVGDSRTAEATLSSIENTDAKESLLVAQQRVRLFRQRRDWNAAAKATEDLIALPGGRKSATIQKLIELYQQAHQPEEALQWIGEWKKISPGSSQTWIVEARLLAAQNEYDKAVEVLRSAVHSFDENNELRAQLAAIYSQQGKLADADRMYWQLYDEAEDLSGKLTWVRELAQTAQVHGRLPQLIEVFEERRQTNRASIQPLLAMAEIHRISYNYEGRRQALLEATRMKPEDIELLHEIARIEESEGDWEGALMTLESALTLDKTARTKEKIAQILLANGKEDQGFQVLTELTDEASMGASAAEGIADTLISNFNWPRAIEFLTPFVERDPNNYRLGYLLAVSLEEDWQTDRALQAFLRLLSIDQEMPTLASKHTIPTPSRNTYYNDLNRFTPPGVSTLLEYRNRRSQAYSYRQTFLSSNARNNYYGTSNSSTIPLPPSVDELELWVMPHISTLATNLDDKLKSELNLQLQSQNIHYPDFFQGIDTDPDFEINFIEKYPDDIVVQAYGVFTGRSLQGAPELDRFKDTFRLFIDSYPGLALMVAMRAYQVHFDKAEELLMEALKSTAESALDPFALNSIGSLLGTHSRANSNPFSDDLRTSFRDTLESWRATAEPSQQSSIFTYLSHLLRVGEEFRPFVQLLNEEQERYERALTTSSTGPLLRLTSLQATRAHANRAARNASSASLIRPIPFTETHNSISNLIRTVLSENDTNANSINHEALSEVLSEVENPLLRALIVYYTGNHEKAHEILSALLLEEDPPVDAHLMAAAIASENGQFTEASMRLSEALSPPLELDLRTIIDASLVSYALKPDVEDTVIETGRDAALRLRKQTLQPREQNELADALSMLGLEDEAESLIANQSSSQLSHISSARGSSAPFYGSPVRNASPYISASQRRSPLMRLIEENRFERAVERAVQELKVHASAHLTSQNATSSYRGSREILQLIQSHSLTPRVLEKAHPGSEVGPRQLAQYAMMCQLLGETDQAHDLFAEVLKRNPQDNAVQMRLFLIEVEEDIDSALERLPNLLSNHILTAGNTIQQSMSNDRRLEHHIEVTEAVIRFLENMADSEALNLSWCYPIVQLLGSNFNEGNVQIPSLYAFDSPDPSSYSDADQQRMEELQTKRRKIHDDLCTAMLRIPQLARVAFHHLTARPLFDAGENERDKFLVLAKEILLLPESRHPRPTSVSYERETYIPMYDPEEYLLTTAWEKGTLPRLRDEILSKLSEDTDAVKVDSITKRFTLYTCSPSEFLEVSSDFLEFEDRPASSLDQGLIPVITAWHDRDIGIELDPILNRAVAHPRFQSTSTSWISHYISILSQRGDTRAIEQFLAILANHYLGPKEERAESITRYFNQSGSWNAASPSGSMMSYLRMLQHFARDEVAIFPAMQEYVRYGFGDLESRYHAHSFENIIYQIQNGERMLRLVKNSPFLGEIEEFQTFPMLNLRRNTFFSSLMDRIKRVQEMRVSVVEFINDQEDPTFGTGIIKAYLDDNQSLLAEHLANYSEHLRDLPQPQRREFTLLLDEFYQDDFDSASLSEDALTLLEEFRSTIDANKEAHFTDYLSAKRYDDLKQWDLDNHTQTLLEYLISDGDIDRAKKLFAKYLRMVDDGMRTGAWNRSYGNQRSHGGRMMERLLSGSKHPYHALAFAMEIFSEPIEGYEIEIQSDLIKQLVSPMIGEYHAAIQKEDEDFHSTFQDLFHKLNKAIGDRPFSLAGPHFVPLFDESPKLDLSDEQKGEWIQWLGNEGGSVATEIAMAARMQQVSRAGDQELSSADQHYLNVLNDTDRPLTWRLATAEALLERNYPSEVTLTVKLPLNFTLTAAERLAEGWESPQTIVPSAVSYSILTAFKELDPEDNPSWNGIATKLVEGWLRSPTATTNRSRGNAKEELLQLLFQLSLKAQASETTNRLLGLYSSELAQNPQALMLLIQFGEVERAIPILRKGWSTMEMDYDEHVYSEYIELALASLLDTIDSPELSYFAELVVKNAPDPSDESEPMRQDRLANLAERFSEVEFTTQMMKERSLFFLSHELSTSEALAEQYEKFAEGVDLAAIMEINDNAFKQPKIAFVTSHIAYSASQGKTEPFLEHLKRVLEYDFQNQYDLRQPLRLLSDALIQGITASSLPSSEEHYATFIHAIDHLLENTPNEVLPYLFQNGSFIHGVIAIYVVSDELEALNPYLDPRNQQPITAYLDLTELLNFIASARSEGEVDVNERIEMFERILSIPVFIEKYNNQSDLIRSVVDTGYLSIESVIEHGATLVNALPREGRAAAELAEILHNAEQPEAALPFWDQAVNESKGELRWHYTTYHQGKARSLSQLGRIEEALFVLESLVYERIDPNLSPSLEEQITSLTMACAEAGLSDNSLDIIVENLNDHPQNELGWKALASFYEKRGNQLYEENLAYASAYFRLALLIHQHHLPSPESSASASKVKAKFLQTEFDLERIAAPRQVISRESSWHYFDVGADLGTDWRTSDFDDEDWRSGEGKLGYNDNPSTVLRYGDDSGAKHTTTYFRTEFPYDFDISETTNLFVSLLRDDGAIVYLNGNEVVRENMPEGDVQHDTFAIESVSVSDEEAYFGSFIDATHLLKGRNVLAVEVHQATPNSSDLGFDLALHTVTASLQDVLEQADQKWIADTLGSEMPRIPDVLHVEVERFPAE